MKRTALPTFLYEVGHWIVLVTEEKKKKKITSCSTGCLYPGSHFRAQAFPQFMRTLPYSILSGNSLKQEQGALLRVQLVLLSHV